MNKDKIAKLIYELRKEKGLTQKELAEKLYISEQAISKWERGICLPNLTMIKELAKIFDISIAEFIAGEKITAENKLEQIDEIYFSSWQEEKRKSYFKSIMLYIIIIFLVIVFISLGFFFLKNYQRIYVYKFKGDTLHYLFTDGLAIYSDKEGLIKIGHFVKDNNFPIADETITKADITIYFDDKELEKISYEKGRESFADWLSDINISYIEDFHQDCKKGCMEDSFVTSNKNEFPNNLKMIMEYCDEIECHSDLFKIKATVMAENDF